MFLCKNIKEFNSLTKKCPFCNHDLQTGLISNHQRFSYKTIIGKIVFSYRGYVYESILEDNNLIFKMKLGNNLLFSIDINTGIISGSPIDNIQRLIYMLGLILMRKCMNEDCDKNNFMFMYQSSPITLGHKSRKIYPVIINSEIVTIAIKNEKFNFVTNNDINLSHLFVWSSPNTPGYSLSEGWAGGSGGESKKLAEFPPVWFFNKNEDVIINKIKTYILFS